jgi:anthranilate synthase component 1
VTELEFQALAAQGFNRIPLLSEHFADLETPLSLYLKLAHKPNSYLLESVLGGERFGRYSFVGLPASTVLRSNDDGVEVIQNGEVVERHVGNPLDFIEVYRQRFRVAARPGLPRFSGGLAGYFGYGVVRHIEPRPGRSNKPDPVGIPDILLLLTEELAIIDTLSGKLYLMVYADPSVPEAYQKAMQRLRALRADLRMPVDIPFSRGNYETPTERIFPREDFLAAVEKAQRYILDGDIQQVQIGQLLCKRFTDSPVTLYRALRSINPSPYMYLYNFGDFQVVGASPEILVRQEHAPAGERVTIRPLAGTRPRGNTPEEDQRLASELLSDPKERAEHHMLIDLARDDLGRIAIPGTVQVTEPMVVEKYSHVMHIVSNVEGLLSPGVGPLEVLRATFPAGTLTGAPKVRAMEVIDELEPTHRGLHGGACGYLSFHGDLDLAIAIRTGVIKEGMLYVQASAGIVADSIPANEWQETEDKARAVLRAAEMVQTGLD